MGSRGSDTYEIERHYAKALFELSCQQGVVECVRDALEKFSAVTNDVPGMRALGYCILYRKCEVTKAVDVISGKLEIHPLCRSFLCVLSRHRRLSMLAGIVKAFGDLCDIRDNISRVTLEVSAPIDDKQMSRLRDLLSDVYGSNMEFHQVINRDIMGGIVVRVGNRMIDFSLRSRLFFIDHALKGRCRGR